MRRSATQTKIILYRSHAKKSGNERVGEQGRWLLANQFTCMPRVYECASNWYSMERLHTLPMNIVHPLKLFREVAAALEVVWSSPARTAVHVGEHTKRAGDLSDEFLSFTQQSRFQDLFTAAGVHRLTPRLSHGDPTFDNVMLRKGGVVLIDPNPAVGSVGDLQEVDLAWMVMSLLNYEARRYGTTPLFDVSINEVQSVLRDVGCITRDIVAVLYFTVFNALRALRYIDQPERREAIIRDIIDPILDLRL